MQYAVTFCVCQGEEKQRYIVYVVTVQAGSAKISKKLLIAVAFRMGNWTGEGGWEEAFFFFAYSFVSFKFCSIYNIIVYMTEDQQTEKHI